MFWHIICLLSIYNKTLMLSLEMNEGIVFKENRFYLIYIPSYFALFFILKNPSFRKGLQLYTVKVFIIKISVWIVYLGY